MNDLVNVAIEAHGGLKRWSRVTAVTAAASITGETWKLKGKPDYLKNVIFAVETKRERVTMDFPGHDKRSVFEPNRVEMQRRDGTFLCTYGGFSSEEIAPIQVDGETWRRLRVTFPDAVKSHTRTQISCFGPDGLLRRQDYIVDILGGAPGLNYASNYREIDGIVFPTTRRVYPYEGDYQRVKEPLLVNIEMRDIALGYASDARETQPL